MDKSRVCMSRTINLAKQKCEGKTSMLVYPKSKKSKPQNVRGCAPRISAPVAKQIRVCTGAELKKMCRPAPCTCPPKPTPCMSLFTRICKILGFGFKSVIAGSLVYWTWEAGIWGDSEDTEKFSTSACQLICAKKPKKILLSETCEAGLEFRETQPNPEDPCSKPPINNERTMYRMKETWNSLITIVFESVVGLPRAAKKWYGGENEESCEAVKKK